MTTDFNELCRFCGGDNQLRIPLLDVTESNSGCGVADSIGNEPNILQKIRYCLPIDMHLKDSFPKGICEVCCQKIHKMYEFIATIIAMEKLWTKRLQQSQQQDGVLSQCSHDGSSCAKTTTVKSSSSLKNTSDEALLIKRISGVPDKIMKLPHLRIQRISVTQLQQQRTDLDRTDIELFNSKERKLLLETSPKKPTNLKDCRNSMESIIDPLNTSIIEKGTRIEPSGKNASLVDATQSSNIQLEDIIETDSLSSDHDDDDDDDDFDFDCKKYSTASNTISAATNSSNKNDMKSVASGNNSIKSGRQKCIVVQMTKPAAYVCMTCKQKFPSFDGLKDHIKTSDQCKQIHLTCDVCGKRCETKKALYQHALTHKEKHTFVCDECGKTYSHRFNLENHKSSVHGEQVEEYGSIYKCKMCSSQFTNRKELYEHIGEHSRVPSVHLCDTCGKCYNSLETLRSHFRIHLNIRPFPCSYCDKRFRSRPQLTQHLHVHTGVKLFQCNQCDKSFAKKGSLSTHIRLHTGELPYLCTVCPEKFPSTNRLKTHAKVHNFTDDNLENK